MAAAVDLAPGAAQQFYACGLGDRLVDELRYPAGIREFLSAERRLLVALRPLFTTLVEIGCMDGRHVEWAATHQKRYLGVEPVARYAAAARHSIRRSKLDPSRYRVVQGGGEDLETIVERQLTPRERSLLFFPFNSFGNASHPSAILNTLMRVARPVLISSYRPTQLATRVRAEYYERCGYHRLRQQSSSSCIRFVTDDGLNSVAYQPRYLRRLAADCGLELRPVRFGRVGLAFVSPDVARHLSGS